MSKSSSSQGHIKNLTFAQSIERINEIAQIADDEEFELEKLVNLYKEGMTLVHACEKKLQKAQQDIEKIDKSTSNL
ncbi:exodeoxyribonuclease VII small subunit [Rickettsiales bacterium]|nr:exodeoxyribonuclease VII small subunit [Rickettsiales bacterium]